MARNMPLVLTNIRDNETVYQRCLLIKGQCTATGNDEDCISIKTFAFNGNESFPEQTWPIASGNFKALVMLSPGMNVLALSQVAHGTALPPVEIAINYVPLLQNPPLHLVIMVAKDSPCIIDCPPTKAAGLSSAHSDLDAAIAKFRMTAYMWQAMTAEDLHKKGLCRRTFRLDERWARDTVSRDFVNAQHDYMTDKEGAMRSTAHVHVIRSSRTVTEIRDASIAQQNPSACNKERLFDYFMEALAEAGGPFTSDSRPIIAGMILDSHYNVSQKLILGHAALGCHNPEGVSLGMMGSHLVYAWPRFMEEIVSCLTSTQKPGDNVGNDNGECTNMWEACSIGQGAHLHEVGHAFGSPHREGIMERGYSHDWPKNFLSQTAYSNYRKVQGCVVDDSTANSACWNDADALSFRMLPHFNLPTDRVCTAEERSGKPSITVDVNGNDPATSEYSIVIKAPIGVCGVSFNDIRENQPTVSRMSPELRFSEELLAKRFDRNEPLRLKVLGYNGTETIVASVWKLLNKRPFVPIPGSSIRLSKRFTWSDQSDVNDDQSNYEWAQLLREKDKNGTLHRAISIDLRVGCIWDGGVVKYADGHTSHWGPMRTGGRKHHFGGHASQKINLPNDVEIKRVEVNRGGYSEMYGVRMHLADGTSRGELNTYNDSANVVSLEPAHDEVIVGFFGQSKKGGFCGVMEFGILCAPKDIGLDGLPDTVYDMEELRNTAGMDEYGVRDQGSDSEQDDSDNTVDDEDGECC